MSLLFRWWKGKVDNARSEFEEAYSRWQEAKSSESWPVLRTKRYVYDSEHQRIREKEELTDAGKALHSMEMMGVVALPYVMEHLREGDHDLLVLADRIIGDAVTKKGLPATRAHQYVVWWQKSGVSTLRPFLDDFEYHFQAWKAHCHSVRLSSALEPYFDSPHYDALRKMGPEVLPALVEKYERGENFPKLGWVWGAITGISGEPSKNPRAKEFRLLDWWEEGQSGTNRRFKEMFAEYKDLKAAGKTEQAREKLKTIRWSLGIAALVPMMKKIKAGHEELLPLVEDLTDEEAQITGETPEKKIQSCAQWWKSNKGKWTVPFPDAGAQ